jgi:hypothetical protein
MPANRFIFVSESIEKAQTEGPGSARQVPDAQSSAHSAKCLTSTCRLSIFIYADGGGADPAQSQVNHYHSTRIDAIRAKLTFRRTQ